MLVVVLVSFHKHEALEVGIYLQGVQLIDCVEKESSVETNIL